MRWPTGPHGWYGDHGHRTGCAQTPRDRDGRDHGQGRWPGLMPRYSAPVLIPAIAGDALTPEEGEQDAVYRSIRPTWVTVTWLALLLVLVAFAAAQTRLAQAPPTGMVAAFVDTNGNDIDDSCEDPATVAAEADPEAEASAEAAVDLDGDGTISVSEAAHSDRIGGKNCNHGGYVSWVAHGSCDDADPAGARDRAGDRAGPRRRTGDD